MVEDQIEAYIRQNRQRYTREAIRKQLIDAGHDPAAVDAAWERVVASSPASAYGTGWRPGWAAFVILLVVGAIGAAVVWAGSDYGAGVIAPVVYAVIVSIAFGIAKLISILIDRGRSAIAAALLGIAAIGGVYLAAINGFAPNPVAAAALTGLLAIVVLVFGNRNRAAVGMIGAGLPILVWLVVTGTCYAPLYMGS